MHHKALLYVDGGFSLTHEHICPFSQSQYIGPSPRHNLAKILSCYDSEGFLTNTCKSRQWFSHRMSDFIAIERSKTGTGDKKRALCAIVVVQLGPADSTFQSKSYLRTNKEHVDALDCSSPPSQLRRMVRPLVSRSSVTSAGYNSNSNDVLTLHCNSASVCSHTEGSASLLRHPPDYRSRVCGKNPEFLLM